MVEVLERTKLRFADDDDDMQDFQIKEELAQDISWYAKKQVELLATKSRGVELITGEPGGGKDLYAVSSAKLYKYFFGRPVILDFVPCRPFGEYTLFDTGTILRKIREIAKALRVDGIEGSEDKKELAQFMEEATIKWLLEGEGYDIFNRAVYYISELKKVAYNRNSMSRNNKFIGSINSVWRHLDLLVIGTHVYENEIDEKAYLQYAKLRTNCTQTLTPNTIRATVMRGMYAGPDFVVSNLRMKPLIFYIDGNEPREFLGGKRFYDLYRTKHMSF